MAESYPMSIRYYDCLTFYTLHSLLPSKLSRLGGTLAFTMTGLPPDRTCYPSQGTQLVMPDPKVFSWGAARPLQESEVGQLELGCESGVVKSIERPIDELKHMVLGHRTFHKFLAQEQVHVDRFSPNSFNDRLCILNKK